MNPAHQLRIRASRGVVKMRLATLLFCISTVGLAANWSGYLVDSGCYASRQTNVSGDTTTVDRDMNMDIRYCSPTAETKKFAVVLTNWRGLKLDSAGNVRASQLVRHAVKRSLFDVTVADQKPGTRDSRGRSTFCRVRCPVSLERREPARVHSFHACAANFSMSRSRASRLTPGSWVQRTSAFAVGVR